MTDGDVRKGILRGLALSDTAERIMRATPTVAKKGEAREKLLALMECTQISQVTILDAAWRVIGLDVIKELLHATQSDNWVVLMAGGEGRRLRPLTNTVPKPLIPVGNQPVLETIIKSFVESNFKKFLFLSIILTNWSDNISETVPVRVPKSDTLLNKKEWARQAH